MGCLLNYLVSLHQFVPNQGSSDIILYDWAFPIFSNALQYRGVDSILVSVNNERKENKQTLEKWYETTAAFFQILWSRASAKILTRNLKVYKRNCE